MDTQGLIKELEAHAARLEDELRRTRAGIAAMLGTSPRSPQPQSVATPTRAQGGTLQKGDTMRRILGTLETHGPMGYRELSDTMLSEGWETTSGNPSNSVRTALGRMAMRGTLARTDDGRYGLPSQIIEDVSDELG